MDILEEARLAVLMQRAAQRSERALTASQALEMATIGGARSLGIDDRAGSIEPGKDADLAAFSLEPARATPVGDIVAAILFAVAGTHAHFVTVKGRIMIEDGRHTSEDAGLRARINAAADSLRSWNEAATWRPATLAGVS
jgi:5-methylthioadenosine/S-adenosylhomocysteine deaminase